MSMLFIDNLTFLRPEWGLIALGMLGLMLLVTIVMKQGKPAYREKHTFFPAEIKNSARVKQRVVSAFFVLSLLVGTLASANPAMATKVATENSFVCPIVDQSTSMGHDDVAPTRDGGMRQALIATIVAAPENAKQCVVAFAGADSVDIVIEPSLNKEEALERIDSMQLSDGTAAGEGIFAAIEVIESLEDSPLRSAQELAEGDEPPVAFVLLSDGASYEGRTLEEAAQKAAELGIPIHTISFGIDEGVRNVNGQDMVITPDPDTMAKVAQITGGEAYEAASSDEVQQIFDSVTTRVATETDFESVAWYFAVLAIAMAVIYWFLRKLWFNRI